MVFAAFRHSRVFRLAALLAFWAMLLPALVPLVHHPAAMMGEMASICHTALGGNNHPQNSDHGKAQPTCPICQGLNSLAQGFVTPDVDTGIVFQPISIALDFHAQAFAIFAPRASAWPRAPPTLA